MWPFPKPIPKANKAKSSGSKNSGTIVSLEDLIRARHSIRASGLGAKKGVHSLLAGGERSPFKGRGIDFEEVRRYQPGDDVKHMDWRVTARSGEPHLKVFREERERPVFLVVDYTSSMLFGTKVAFKSVTAARAASLLAWASIDRGDRIGAVVFSDSGHGEQRPRGGRSGVLQVLHLLVKHHQEARHVESQAHGNGHASFVSALRRVTRTARPGSLVFLLSDFRNLNSDTATYLTRLSAHHDVVSVLMYDTLEREPPLPGVYRVTNGTDFGMLDSRQSRFVEGYREQFRRRYDYVKELCQQSGIGFFPVATNDPIEDAVGDGMRRIVSHRTHTARITAVGV